MTELSRGHTIPAPESLAAPPASYLQEPGTHRGSPVDQDRERWEAEDALVDAEAAEAAAARRVRIAEEVVEELGEDAKSSAQLAAQDRLETATSMYEAAETRTRRARAALDALARRGEVAAPNSDLAYPNADAWLRGWLLPNWRRPVQQHWCAKWWLHAEAVSRIEALWRAWEHLRGDGALGPSTWWRDHADYHLAVLTSSMGTFARCNYRRSTHQQEDVLPVVANPLNLAEFVG